jgi:transcriptional regulator with XRE-family HTH domain
MVRRRRYQPGRKRPILEGQAPVASAIQRARQTLGLSQADLGRALDVSALTISRWETQRAKVAKPKLDALFERLAKKDRKLAVELAKSVGLGGNPALAPSPESRRAQLEQVVLRTAEALDIVPSLAKKVTCEVVTRLARVNLGPQEAMVLLGLEPEG